MSTDKLLQTIAEFEHWCTNQDRQDLEKFLDQFECPHSIQEELRRHVARKREIERKYSGSDQASVESVSINGPYPETEPALFDEPGADLRTHVSQIDNYKLLHKIGEGGMGSVWCAEQQEPVVRHVALKVIRSDRSGKEIVARFEVERQALAMMDHQNIARVIDGGTTIHGYPYFVMELVDGTPLNQYCNENNIDIFERLNIFLKICSAIQHAHQKGIIHRDLKPSNVLVAEKDGEPVPKVIDFGLVKVIDQKIKFTDETLETQVGKVLGTLKYMAPEQAEAGSRDIDTRVDVYSLGVMLYEILTGSVPLQSSADQMELLQVLDSIRSKDPPRPSQRLKQLDSNVVSLLGDQRQISPLRLQGLLKGELDWIVMKALEKKRSRRYETPLHLADDIRNFLDNKPIVARPASRIYQLRKFVSRNRFTVGSITLVLVALCLGALAASIIAKRQYTRAEQATARKNSAEMARVESEKQAEIAQLEAEKRIEIAEADKYRALELRDLKNSQDFAISQIGKLIDADMSKPEAVEALKLALETDLAEMPEQQIQFLMGLSDELIEFIGPGQAIELNQLAIDLIKQHHANDKDLLLNAQNRLASNFLTAGRMKEYLELQKEVYDETLKLFGKDNPKTTAELNNLATAHAKNQNFLEAIEKYHSLLDGLNSNPAVNARRIIDTKSNLANLYLDKGDKDKAVKLFREVLNQASEFYQGDESKLHTMHHNLGTALLESARLKEAEQELKIAWNSRKKILGANKRATLMSGNSLAGVYLYRKKPELAIDTYADIVPMLRVRMGPAVPLTTAATLNYSSALQMIGDNKSALELRRKVVEDLEAKHGSTYSQLGVPLFKLAESLWQFRLAEDALINLDKAKQITGGNLPATHQLNQAISRKRQNVLIYLEKYELAERAALDWKTSLGNQTIANRVAIGAAVAGVAYSKWGQQQYDSASETAKDSLRLMGNFQWALKKVNLMHYRCRAELVLVDEKIRNKDFESAEKQLVRIVELLESLNANEFPSIKAVTSEAIMTAIGLYTTWEKPAKKNDWQNRLIKLNETWTNEPD